MNIADAEGRYYLALHKLSDLVTRRNQLLFELQGMSAGAVTQMPSTGVVRTFSVERSRALVKRISRLNSQIERAMATVNRYAERAGQHPVEWQHARADGDESSEAGEPSAA